MMKNIVCDFINSVCHCFCSKADSSGNIKDSLVKTELKPVRQKVYRINYFVEGAIIAVGMVGI